MSEGNNLRVAFSIAAGEFRRWQKHVIDRFVDAPGISTVVTASSGRSEEILGLESLFALERLFVPADFLSAVDPIDRPPVAAPGGGADLVVDLGGGATAAPGLTVLVPTCLGLPPLLGALTAVLDGLSPTLEIDRVEPSGERRVIARWRVGVEDRHNTLLAVSQILGRLAHMVTVAVEDHRLGRPDGGRRLVAPMAGGTGSRPLIGPRLLARAVSSRILRRLERRLRTPPDWRVIWRRRDPATAPLAPGADPTPFRLLPDDGRRFYADPFVWTREGRTWLFLEEFPYATGRGVLSLVEIGADGPIGTPRPFLEQDCHLSYPQIFAADGEIWMVPETSGRRTVELWRAVAFPDRWEKAAILLDDVDVGDATLVRREDGWWMFGCRRERWCSSWDALHVWHAPALSGPWREIAQAPALVDVASARPAGAMFATAEGLLRPVQDSERGYGHGLALARIDRLGEDGFAETIVERFTTPAPLEGLHTWNRVEDARGLIEVMDVFVRARDFGATRRLDLGGRSG